MKVFLLVVSLFLSCLVTVCMIPEYDKISPEIGWERYSGDSARSINGWIKWWKYIFLKEPSVVKWVNGLLIKIYPNNEIFRAIFVRGIYDPNLVTVINALLPKGGVFVDVGASIGYVSLLASKVLGSNGHVFALEPSSRDYVRLFDNININSLNSIISSYRLAISDKNGIAKLSIACEERNVLNTIGAEFSSKGVEKIGLEEIETKTIDTFVKENEINRIDVLKLDIQGSELDALKGAEDTIERYRPIIVLGINKNALKSCGVDREKIQNILNKMKYIVYRIVETPVFCLKKVSSILNLNEDVVFCFHDSKVPPILPQSESNSVCKRILNFLFR